MQVSSGRDSVHVRVPLITRSRLIVQIQTLLFRQSRHHCLCILQLDNVQAFVHVLGSRFHCESSAVTIVYTSVLESHLHGIPHVFRSTHAQTDIAPVRRV